MSDAKPSDDWSGIFTDRGFLQLTPEVLARWVSENALFFGALRTLFKSGATVLDVGSGPGRHACGAASLGYRVIGVELDPALASQAAANAARTVPDAGIQFHCADMADIADFMPDGGFHVVTHGGLLEHLPSVEAIRAEIDRHLGFAPHVVFDVPVATERNLALFSRDQVFRQVWPAAFWLDTVFSCFNVTQAGEEARSNPHMTDDLVVWLSS